nr:MAG TPA: hypothetical protein [Caudoviricetes sp.]
MNYCQHLFEFNVDFFSLLCYIVFTEERRTEWMIYFLYIKI